MNVLVVGGGGREHALVWKLKQSKRLCEIYCAPGNAGISEIAKCVDISTTDFNGLIKFAKEYNIDITVVGPDEPLVLGIVDAFEAEGLMIFGPRKNAAIIEGSKSFSKELMRKYKIPTANYEVFDNYKNAVDYIKSNNKFPIVLKADGLALGKGVLICDDFKSAEDGLKEILVNKKFGKSGNKVVIEEFLTGHEVSILAFCDGETVSPMVSAQDHKRAYDGDKGLNTGGMGTFSPSRYYTDDIAKTCLKTIFTPTVKALKAEGRPFKGIIFFGLMLTEDHGPKVIEYNARFGDPETQVILTRLKSDLLTIMWSCINGLLKNFKVEWDNNAAACVVLASGGYPENYKKGYEISGLDDLKSLENVYAFHAGTSFDKNNKICTNGGRVIGITSVEKDLDSAIKSAYVAVSKVSFKDMHYRKDIGVK